MKKAATLNSCSDWLGMALCLRHSVHSRLARHFADHRHTDGNLDGNPKRMVGDPEAQRWREQTDSCQLPLPDAAAKGKIWSDTKEIYFLK